MKKTLKKILMFSFTFLMSITILGFNVKAHDSIESKGQIYCDSSPNGIHQMYAKGLGTLKRLNSDGSKTLIYTDGCTWQCKYCLTVMLTKGEAAQGQAIGNYATWEPGYAVSPYGTVLISKNIWYTSSSRIPGYSFRYN